MYATMQFASSDRDTLDIRHSFSEVSGRIVISVVAETRAGSVGTEVATVAELILSLPPEQMRQVSETIQKAVKVYDTENAVQ